MSPIKFSRPAALSILLALGVCFAANHVAARVAFDNGVGVTTAILMRSGITALVLWAVVLWQRVAQPQPRPRLHWVLCVGGLVALQSLCLYSAVARVPVVLALLVFNTMPLLYALLTWALGGLRPSSRALMCMGVILLGLAMALDVVARLQGQASSVSTATLWVGVGFAFAAASTMACALWITERRLTNVPGTLRSLWTMGLVFTAMLALSVGGAALNTPMLPGGMAWPANALGWWALAALVACYGTAFSLWFIWMPRLDMARNGSALNIEPIAVLVMAWLFLGQSLSALQLVGALVVVAGIVLLARQPKTLEPQS
jgi:drug/metabolite transporter (DMT)-like permease